jgi:predicted porin
MKKPLLAAALLAGFAGAASAQSSVTLYGVVDVGVLSQTLKTGDNDPKGNQTRNTTGMASGQQSSSRWGLKGVEDLGNGLSANFVYEQGVNVASGATGDGFARQATLGIVSKSWGGVDLGRRVTPGTNAFSGIDPFGTNFGTSSLTSSMGMAFARYSNMIAYQTPTISGFTGGIGYSFDATQNGSAVVNASNSANYAGATNRFGSTTKTRGFGLGLRYGNGPLVVAGTLDIVMPAAWKSGTPTEAIQYVTQAATTKSIADAAKANAAYNNLSKAGNVTQWNLGATYDFKVVKAHVAYGQNIGGILAGQNLGDNVGAGGDTNSKGGFLFRNGARTSSWMVGLTAPVGASGSVFASWQQMMAGGDLKQLANTSTQNVGSIGYTYSLSKRTNLYAYYSYMSNVAMLTGAQSNSLGVGVRHLF